MLRRRTKESPVPLLIMEGEHSSGLLWRAKKLKEPFLPVFFTKKVMIRYSAHTILKKIIIERIKINARRGKEKIKTNPNKLNYSKRKIW